MPHLLEGGGRLAVVEVSVMVDQVGVEMERSRTHEGCGDPALEYLGQNAIHGRDHEIIMRLARQESMQQIGKAYGITRQRIQQIRERIFFDHPELEHIVGRKWRVNQGLTLKEYSRMRAHDRERLFEEMKQLRLYKRMPEWTPEYMAALGLELIEYYPIQGDPLEHLMNLYGIRAWISHKWCYGCKQLLGYEKFSPGSEWKPTSQMCTACSSERGKRRWAATKMMDRKIEQVSALAKRPKAETPA